MCIEHSLLYILNIYNINLFVSFIFISFIYFIPFFICLYNSEIISIKKKLKSVR